MPTPPDSPAPPRRPAPGALVLLRHGESTYNATNRFTGLLDVPLSERGAREARYAATVLADVVGRRPELAPARVVTSPLVRSATTASIVAAALPGPPPVTSDWRLVERHYGAFTDKLRDAVRETYGEDAYWRYRRSFAHRPPPLAADDPARARVDETLHRLPDDAEVRPDAESLADVVERLRPFWAATRAAIARGESLLVVGHGNSLRALAVLVDRLSPEQVRELNVPTGHPLAYRFERTEGASDAGLRPTTRGGLYLDAAGAEDALAELARRGGT